MVQGESGCTEEMYLLLGAFNELATLNGRPGDEFLVSSSPQSKVTGHGSSIAHQL